MCALAGLPDQDLLGGVRVCRLRRDLPHPLHARHARARHGRGRRHQRPRHRRVRPRPALPPRQVSRYPCCVDISIISTVSPPAAAPCSPAS